MSRKKRQRSSYDIYHVVMRAIDKQIIFEEDSDYLTFIQILQEYKEMVHFELYAYCLMDNHVHLLVKEGDEEIGVTMKRIGVKFVRWYNLKYSRTGHLFQGRYGSEPIEDLRYFLTVFRYIHHNPIHGGAEHVLGSYPWSSWRDYEEEQETWIDKKAALAHFGSIESCMSFLNTVTTDKGYEGKESYILSDENALAIMKEVSGCASHTEFLRLDIRKRNKALKEMRSYRISERQISRITGVSRGVISQALLPQGE